MNLAYTMTETPGDLDQVLFTLAGRLAGQGLKTAGVVQVNTDRDDYHPCDMDVSVLPDGPTIRISQFLGKGAKGCRLDADALEMAVGEVSQRLTPDTDVLIINKFGKHEADGRGFRDLIAEALAMEIPVIAGVNAVNREAFMEFSEGLAVAVDPKPEALADWLETARDAAAQPA